MPAEQAPMLLPQVVPTSGTPSSIWPLQLLSMPSHTSGEGALGFWQLHAPPLHTSDPLLQGAVSTPLPLHVPPEGGLQCRFGFTRGNEQQLPAFLQQPLAPAAGPSVRVPSSMTPLQLLSMPSHFSGVG